MTIKNKLFAGAVALCTVIGSLTPMTLHAASSHPIYRLYNPYTGEHFYTAYTEERNNLMYGGWTYEGVGWNAPDSGWYVYRLLNPNTGDHHYCMDTDERDNLIARGWTYEGVGWASVSVAWEDRKTARGIPVYRVYNPNASTATHHYTTDAAEVRALQKLGWRYEGVGWYGSAY